MIFPVSRFSSTHARMIDLSQPTNENQSHRIINNSVALLIYYDVIVCDVVVIIRLRYFTIVRDAANLCAEK